MKTFKEKFILKNIDFCLNLSKQNKSIVIYSNPIKSDEFLLNIIFKKDYFKQVLCKKRKIDSDLYFVLHISHNFPTNSPHIFCLTSLSQIGIELCDGKDLLEDIIEDIWDNKLSLKSIILKIPEFIDKCLEKKYNKIFLGKYLLNYEYNYNLLLKIPHQYFHNVEQIINIKSGKLEKRFLMITSSFFLLFSYKSSYLNYNEFKLLFWGSIFSICGMKKEESKLEFEFIKNVNHKIIIYLNTKEGDSIINILLLILKTRGVDYSFQEEEKRKKLPKIDSEKFKNINI